MIACPFGGIHIDPSDGRTVKCDLCEGYAMCAQFCPREAILYLEPSELTNRLREKGVKKAAEFLHIITGGSTK
jgi:Fe-S-cluster-containing hydrogenase component 2